MITLPTTWSETCFNFKIVERQGDLAIALKTYNHKGAVPDSFVAYEIAYVQSRGDLSFDKGETISPGREYWPSDESFGKEAWTATSLERAQEILSRELKIEEWLKANPRTMSNLDKDGQVRINPKTGSPEASKEIKATRVHAKAALGL